MQLTRYFIGAVDREEYIDKFVGPVPPKWRKSKEFNPLNLLLFSNKKNAQNFIDLCVFSQDFLKAEFQVREIKFTVSVK